MSYLKRNKNINVIRKEEQQKTKTSHNQAEESQKNKQPNTPKNLPQFLNNQLASEIDLTRMLPTDEVLEFDSIPKNFEITRILSELKNLSFKFLTSDFQNIDKSELINELADQKLSLTELVSSLKSNIENQIQPFENEKSENLNDSKNRQNEQHSKSKKNEELDIDFNLEFNKKLDDYHYTNNKAQLNNDFSILLNFQIEDKRKKITKIQIGLKDQKITNPHCINKSEERSPKKIDLSLFKKDPMQTKTLNKNTKIMSKKIQKFQSNGGTSFQFHEKSKFCKAARGKLTVSKNETDNNKINSTNYENGNNLNLLKTPFKEEVKFGNLNAQKLDYSLGEPMMMNFQTDNRFSFDALSIIDSEDQFPDFEMKKNFPNNLSKRDDEAIYGIINLETNAFDREIVIVQSESLYDFFF